MKVPDFQPLQHQANADQNTQEPIKLHDTFSEYSLTDGQTELVNQLARFLDSKDDHVFLLKGYAGTGKTFITKGLTAYFRAIGRNYVLAAPTGKASKVIAKKTQSPAYTLHKTIYSFKDMIEYREDNVEGSETYKVYAQLAINDMSADTVFIIDEASMIADIYSEEEFFRFGSGYLLRDFFKYVNLDHNDHQKKVIFIGDDAQLPPVGMNFSPALDAKYLQQEYAIHCLGYELTEVVRQKANSGVIHNAIKLRESLKKGIFNQLTINLHYPDVAKVSHQDLVSAYMNSCGAKINAESIVVAHSNADVAAYNRQIRAQFFPDMAQLTCGDKVMAVSNSHAYGFFISNGDFGLIKEVLSNTEHRHMTLRSKNSDTQKIEEVSIRLAFIDVFIGFKDLEGKTHFFEAKVLEDLLYSEHAGLSSDESKALYIDFCMRHPQLKRNSLEFKQTLKADPYFNALRLKFGYAITCHKAQGSEWNHVFVKCKTHQSQLSADYFRWFYTAITRTAHKLYVLDPPDIKLGSGIKGVASPNMAINHGVNAAPTPLAVVQSAPAAISIQHATPQNLGVTAMDETFGIPFNAGFSLELLKRIKELTLNTGIQIQQVTQGQYQDCYVFEKDNDMTRVDIIYNGKGKISKITTPRPSEFSQEMRFLLAPLNGVIVMSTAPVSPVSIEFAEAFLNDFYQRLLPLVMQKGIVISRVEAMEWKQRYTFIQSGESAVFDVFYNGKKCFTKYAAVNNACSSNALCADIATLLTEGLSA
ncbi:MAG: AAA family ATPase [Pseudomonadales bacterium]|nr:AAA family ATPase [Pseudomonadales bacterium]